MLLTTEKRRLFIKTQACSREPGPKIPWFPCKTILEIITSRFVAPRTLWRWAESSHRDYYRRTIGNWTPYSMGTCNLLTWKSRISSIFLWANMDKGCWITITTYTGLHRLRIVRDKYRWSHIQSFIARIGSSSRANPHGGDDLPWSPSSYIFNIRLTFRLLISHYI